MKKLFGCILSVFAFLFVFTSKVDAIEYDGKLGYSYTNGYTEFYFISDNENIEVINLMLESIDNPIELVEIESGVYYHNQSGDLKDKEYYYNVCFTDLSCLDILDPFALTINTVGNKNVILDTHSFSVNGWNSIHTNPGDFFSNSIYAIEADKFVKQLTIVQPSSDGADIGGEFDGVLGGLGGIGNQNQQTYTDSVFSKLAHTTTYENNSDVSQITGYDYIVQSGMKYLEIGDLYDKNNYYSPNQSFSSKLNAYSAIKEYKELLISYQSAGMNVVARMDLSYPSDSLKTSLKTFSSNYITNEGMINLTDPMMKRYIESIYKHWVNEYKIDGFYITNASLYGETYLASLISKLKDINTDLFIYTDSVELSEYYASDELQTLLLGSLNDSTNTGIINGNYSEESFDKLINAMFSGYYSNLKEYEKASKVINNIGSLDGLDIYSKIKLIAGITKDDDVVKNKINVVLYTLFGSAGIPRLVAGNEFLNTTVIPSAQISTTPSENKVCTSTNAYCYAKGSAKSFDWGHLIRYSSKLTNMMAYRTRYNYQYPSVYSMVHGKNISYDKELTKQGLLYVIIEYDPEYVGDIEKTYMLINYSETAKNIPHISDKDYSSITSLMGRVDKGDDTTVHPLTFFTFTETKVNKISNFVYIIIAIGLVIFIFGLRAILVKILKTKRGIDYNEYRKQKIEEEKALRKSKKTKSREMNVFETYLSDDPIFKRKKKENKDTGSIDNVDEKEQDNKENENK